MKLKSKLLLVASAALVVSGTAAGTSTFAWYTANRIVGNEVDTIAVRSETTSLSIGFDSRNSDSGFTNSGAGTSGTDRLITTYNSDISDVSGLGKLTIPASNAAALPDIKGSIHSFVKPYIDSEGTNVAGWWSAENVAKNFYMITYSFVAEGATPTYVLLSPSSTITDGNTIQGTTDLTVKKDVRFSALVNTFTSKDSTTPANDGTGKISDVVTVLTSTQSLYADVTNTASTDKYATGGDANGTPLTGTSSIGTAVVSDATPAVQALGNDNFFAGIQTEYTESDFSTGTASSKLGYLCTLDPKKTPTDASTPNFASITFLFWIEGETTDYTSTTSFQDNFIADLKFYTVMVA